MHRPPYLSFSPNIWPQVLNVVPSIIIVAVLICPVFVVQGSVSSTTDAFWYDDQNELAKKSPERTMNSEFYCGYSCRWVVAAVWDKRGWRQWFVSCVPLATTRHNSVIACLSLSWHTLRRPLVATLFENRNAEVSSFGFPRHAVSEPTKAFLCHMPCQGHMSLMNQRRIGSYFRVAVQ